MKVYDRVEKAEKDLSTAELIDLMANHNRQVDLRQRPPMKTAMFGTGKTGPAWTASASSAAIFWRAGP